MPNKYTYLKSEGEEIWTVGHDDNGKWIPESDWESEELAKSRATILNYGAHHFDSNLRKRIEEMHKGYRRERAIAAFQLTQEYHRGAADACANILDLPELRLFLPAKDGGE